MRSFPTFLVVYSLLYAAFGVQSPFLPALLRERGLHAEEIGIVLAASTAIRVLAGPAVGHAADRLRMHVFTLCACALAAAVASLGYVMIRGFDGLLIVGLVHAAMLAPIVPISDALSTTAARRSEAAESKRFEYGWLRASGSAAFIAGTVLSGRGADRTGLTSITWISGSFLVAGGIASLMLPGLGGSQTEPSRIQTSALHDWALLLHLAVFRQILVIAALTEGSHALNDTFAVIRWHAAGRSDDDQRSLVRVGLLGGSGFPMARTKAASTYERRWRICPGCGCRRYPLVSLGLHNVANPAGGCPAIAWRHIRIAAFGVHARDRAGGATPFGSDGAIDLRNAVHRIGDRLTESGLWRPLRATGRFRLLRHGRTLCAGAANVCRTPFIPGAGIPSMRRSADPSGAVCPSGSGDPAVHRIDVSSDHP